jgi:hypothetical protein
MVRVIRTRSALLAVTTALVIGCGGTTTPPSPSPAPSVAPSQAATDAPTPAPTPSPTASATATPAASQATTGRIEVPDKGFAVTLPDGWQSFPVDPKALQEMADALGTSSGIGQTLQGAIDSGQTAALSFWAFDMGEERVGTRSITILTQPASHIPLALVESAVKGQISAISGTGEIVSETVTLPAGEAVRLTYPLTVTAANGASVKTSQSLWWIQGDNRTIVITGTGPTAAKDADLKAIAESIEEI